MKEACWFAGAWAAAMSRKEPDMDRARIVEWRQGWGMPRIDRSIAGGPLTLGGRVYERGLGTHADSAIRIRAPGPIRTIRAFAGLDDNPATRASAANRGAPKRLLFSVEAGGREVWRGGPVGLNDQPLAVEGAGGGSEDVVLKVAETSGRIEYAHADWAGLEITLADGSVWRLDGGPFAAQWLPVCSPPFSFRIGGKDSGEAMRNWSFSSQRAPEDENAVRDVCAWRDPHSGVEIEAEILTHRGFPAVEWVLRFRNTGECSSPILEDVQALDASWLGIGDVILRRSRGSTCRISDFEYLVSPIGVGERVAMAAGGGRSSNEWLPFFNLQTGDTGVIAAVGWSGQWAASFSREGESLVRLKAGQELTRFALHAGEVVRTPRILLLFWNGDPQDGHNVLRRFLLARHVPRLDGKILRAPLTVAHWGGMKTADHLARIDVYRRKGLEYEYYWVDAGWYGPPDSYSPDEFTGDWARHVGNWNVNPAAHPEGLLPISRAAAQAGMKFLVWVEPERAVCGTPLTEEHPEWFLGERKPGANLLFNLSDPGARKWLADFLSRFIEREGIHLYRQDFNFDPLPYWRAADGPDRQGITEMKYVEGLYELWDELLRRRRGLVIDNCASGGRRIDLETISRSIPLWRSDWQCWPDNDPIGGQTHWMGLSYWVPLHGTGTWGARLNGDRRDTYRVRSAYGPAFQFSLFPYAHTGIRDDYNWDWHRRMLAEYRRARPLFYGDYYPLTGCSPAGDAWAAMQFHRPDLGEGIVIAFRRPDSPFITAEFRLRGIEPESRYQVENTDSGEIRVEDGALLAGRGLAVTMEQAPDSRVFFYRRHVAADP